MGTVYAAISDISAFGRALTAQEQDAAYVLLETASAKLRIISKRFGIDIDALIANDEDYLLAVKQTIVRAVIRAFDTIADSSPPAVQASQAAMGYSVSMTYLNSGQSLYFLKNELKELGILRQRWGALEVYSDNENDH